VPESPTLERLEALTGYLARRFHSDLVIDNADAYLGAALIALVRTMVAESRAIIALCKAALPESSHTHLRPMLEARMEVDVILRGPDNRKNAIGYIAFGLLELRAMRDGQGKESDGIDERIDTLRKHAPDVVAAAEADREHGRPPLYWPKTSRKALLKELYPAHPKMLDLYKFFSWDAHQILTAVVEVDVDESGPEPQIRFMPRQPADEAQQFAVTLAHNMLGDTWDKVAPALKIRAWERGEK
jgi:hypothetical protein